MPPLPSWSAAAIAMTALMIAARSSGAGASASSGFETRVVKVGHVRRTYAVWRPPGFRDDRRWPAILFLHGSGECGDDGLKPTRIGLGPVLMAHPDRWPFVVVFPQKPREEEEWEEHESLVFGVLKDAIRHDAIDPTRVALVGISQGGHGAWMIGARHPDCFSALVAVCGYGRERTVSPRVASRPVWAFHGLKDDLVDPHDTREIVAGIQRERARLGLDSTGVRMTLYPDANHNSWDPAFAEAELPAWILAQRPARGTVRAR